MSRVGSLAWLFAMTSAGSLTSDGMRAQDPLSVQNRPEEVFGEPIRSVSSSEDPSWFEDGEAPLFRRLPPTEDDFVAGADQPGQIARSRPFGGGPPGEGRAPFKARLFWIPSQTLKGQPGSLGVDGEEFDWGFPVRIDPDGIWLALGGAQRLGISTDAVFQNSGLPVPNELWDIEFGTMRVRELNDGWQAGGMLRVGSPSDQPFAAWRDLTVTLLGFLTIPRGERDAWSFSLFYSPTGQIIYPIPGIAYIWRPSDWFQANLGIPFSIEYTPTETLAVTVSYMPLTNVQVLIRQSLGDFWSIYGGYRTVNETFLLADRLNDRERTYVFDQRLTVGVQRNLGRGWSLDLSAAYVFDRLVFQAEKFSGTRSDELAIDAGVAGNLQLLWNR